jgi:hypothetical protein
MESQPESPVAELAAAQLEAYNRADIEAFCACYHEDVRVLDEQGEARTEGIEDFRAGYGAMFAKLREVRAEVDRRLVLGRHCVDLERWSRLDPETGERSEGVVLVRYTERDGKLAIVEFLR